MSDKDDLPTVAAIAVLAMCVVTTAHEALGHGSACLITGGRIAQLTSALFHCSRQNVWIDPAGPVTDLAVGTCALIVGRFATAPALRLFLLLVTTLSYGWEGGYAVQAMIKQDGDLYFAGRSFLSAPDTLWRIAGAVAGIALYLINIRLASSGLTRLWPQAERARRAARIASLVAVVAAGVAALTYAGPIGRDLHDAVLEIAAGALPLLIIPRRDGTAGEAVTLMRRPGLIVLAIGLFAVFVATLGHGIGG